MRVFNRIFLGLMMPLFLFSCSSHFHESWQDIAVMQWQRDNVITNKVNIENIDKPYNIMLGLRYIPAIPETDIKVVLEIINPKGEKIQKTHSIKVKNDKGEHVGEIMGELADVKQIVEEGYTFKEKGEYTFNIVQAMASDPQGGILEVGFILDEKK